MQHWLKPQWLVLVSISWFSVAVSAAETSNAVPESASVVLRIKAPRATVGKLGEFVDAVQPGYGAAVQGGLSALGMGIVNPGLTGVDVEKDWWVITFIESRQKPAVVFVVPTSDADAMKKALPSGFEAHVADKQVAYSDNSAALGKVRDQLSSKGNGLWSKIDGSSKTLFDNSDVSVLVHLRQLSKAFENELQQAEPQLDGLLNQISAAMPEAQRAQILPMLEMYRVIGKSAVQGVRDSVSLTLGISFSKEAIRIEDRLLVSEGTPTAAFFASQPTGNMSLLARMPANKAVYYGAKADMSGMVDWSMKMTRSMMGDLPAEQKDQLDAAMKEMRTLKWNEMTGYFDLDPSGPGAIRAGMMAEITPTQRLRDLSRAMSKAMGEFRSFGFKQTTKLEPAVEKIGGAEVDRITTVQEFDPALDPLGIQKKIRDALFGDAGMVQHVMYQPTRMLQTFGGGTAELQSLATALDSTTSPDTAATAARKRLVGKANVIVLADLARLVASGVRLASREGVLRVDGAAMDGLGLKPSFIGLSIACEPTSVGAQLDIPVEQAQGIAKIAMLIIQGARQ
jgi:hypothetical protein